LDEPQRSTLAELRRTILDIVPAAEETISYGMPAFRLNGKVIAGFAAFKHHVSYFPHSGSVLAVLKDDLVGYKTSKGTLRFASDVPLPRPLVEKLLAVRIEQALEPELRKR
uniref:YdhG-like domain-containing protein n=1 Tax=Anopheles coluzzii TaxID=1518534 RepID=A0A8W7P233_ANOCL